MMFAVVEFVPDGFSPDGSDGLVVTQEDIVWIEFYHLLQADDDDVNIFPMELE